MRYPNGYGAKTKREIIRATAYTLRTEGVSQTGIVRVMESLGLTRGGFYLHFHSKQDLVEAAILSALTETRDQLQMAADSAVDPHATAFEALVRWYLSPAFLHDPGEGCVLPAIGAELGRFHQLTRAKLVGAVERIEATIAGTIPRRSRDARRIAKVVLVSMVGTLQLARMTPGRAAGVAILERGVATAIALSRMDIVPAV